MLANTRQTYGLVAQILHWVTALLILFLLVLGIYMHELPIDTVEQVDTKVWLYSLHKTLGISAFAIAIIRVGWAITQPKPLPLHSERMFESQVAATIHWLLYGAIILMPITGWLHHAALEGFAPIWWPFSQELPFVPKNPQIAEIFGNAHFVTALLLMLSIALHIAGAVKHALIDRDQTMRRMMPGKSNDIEALTLPATNKHLPGLLAGSVFALLLISVFSSQLFVGDKEDAVAPDQTTASSGGWVVDDEKSKLEIEIIQGGKPVTGSFANWQAEIEFDPENLGAATVAVNVDIASLTLGSITEQAISKDFLNAEEHPQAAFSANRFVKLDEGKYEAAGELSLVGNTKPFTLPFDLKIENGRAFMTSVAAVQRLDFGLGEKGFKTDGILGFTVQINVTLEAERQ